VNCGSRTHHHRPAARQARQLPFDHRASESSAPAQRSFAWGEFAQIRPLLCFSDDVFERAVVDEPKTATTDSRPGLGLLESAHASDYSRQIAGGKPRGAFLSEISER